MPASPDAREIVKAIEANTRAIERLAKSFDKLAKAPRFKPLQIDLESLESDNSTIDGPNGPIEPR